MDLRQKVQALRQEAQALQAEARVKLDLAKRCEAEAANPSPRPEVLPECKVCGKPVEPWGIPGTLQGCHAFLSLHEGKVRTVYFGAVHEECQKEDWPRQVDDAVKRGWLIPTAEGKYEVAPAYR